ncbi:transcription factor DYT1-like [Durio zibethinus]|uniref:Transcription factor DYT1-like n=1 Tax=Durio zibethinus TaxID=66656 RepID=A0A6P5X4W9_DURZI|nr:transcription factor DYT1-like [Durio zibethinus]
MDMEFVGSDMTILSITDPGPSRGRAGRRKLEDGDNKELKSKNLHAERRRRQKLSDRLLTLRSVVPIITNMNKATIIEDAITYIQELQKTSQVLSDQLLEMEKSSGEGRNSKRTEVDAAEDMKKCGIKEEVQVINIDGNKLLLKIILEKKRGCFTKLMEAMNYLGFELSETNVTTFKGAMLFSSCVQGAYGDNLMVKQTQEFLSEIIRRMRNCSECAIDDSKNMTQRILLLIVVERKP